MKNFLRNYVVCLLTLLVLTWLLPNVSLGFAVGNQFSWEGLMKALPIVLMASLILTFLMMLARPFLKAVFLPVNFVTLGLFNTVINLFLIWLSTYLVPGFVIGDLTMWGVHLGQIGGLVVFSMLFSLVQTLIQVLF